MDKNSPQLVVFIGGHNHAGKSTLIAALTNLLQEHGIECKGLVNRVDDLDQIDILAKDSTFRENNLNEIAKKGTFVETVELTGLETAHMLENLHLKPRPVQEGGERSVSTFEYHRELIARN